MGLGEALVIFLILLFLNLALIFINLFKRGMLVKNIVGFAVVQVYILLVAILLFILVSIICMVLRKTKFNLVRILSAESVGLVYISFWYSDKFVLLLIISLIVYAATIGYRYYKEKTGY